MSAELEFGLLGPFFVLRDRAPVQVPQGKQRVLLTALLLNAGRVVSVGELSDMMWGAEPPVSARVTLQNYVKRLRALLGESGRRISTVPPGYLIHVKPGELDVQRFESLLSAGRAAARAGGWADAAARLGQALSLWRGEPLDGVSSAALTQREVPRLAELRLQALEARIDAELHIGRQAEVIAELRRLVSEYPLRERLHAQLMLALYTDGRQADALAAYQAIRDTLITELGTEPGTELRGLQQRILAHDAALTGRHAAGTPTGPPRQLPAATCHFTGRTRELRFLTGRLAGARGASGPGGGGTVLISAIVGMPGVGKTALALHWAHQVAGRFPDGQLYANLQGFDPSRAPADPAAVIRRFLGALQVPAYAIPAGLDEQAALYRSTLAGRRVLVVLDNAHDAGQLRPLLPGTPGCLVLVTSRRRLASLVVTEGAHALPLGLFTAAEARGLLARLLGGRRVAAEPAAVDELIALCGRLPLALASAAARVVDRPQAPLAVLAAELREERQRLDALDAGEAPASVRAVFSWSYENLSGPGARMFRLLGVHPGPDITAAAAASLAAQPVTAAREALRELGAAHLVTEHPQGRYHLHHLLRTYAAERSLTDMPDAERAAAEHRMLDHYLHTSQAVSLLLDSGPLDSGPDDSGVALTPAPARAGVTPERPDSYEQAVAWADAERRVLLAMVEHAARNGFAAHARQLPLTLETFLSGRGERQGRRGRRAGQRRRRP